MNVVRGGGQPVRLAEAEGCQTCRVGDNSDWQAERESLKFIPQTQRSKQEGFSDPGSCLFIVIPARRVL